MVIKMKDIVKCYFRSIPKYVPDDLILVSGNVGCLVVGEYQYVKELISNIPKEEYYLEYETVNKLLDYPSLIDQNVRIEKGAVIRENVKLGNGTVILMNASINVNSQIGDYTMIDMNTVVGSGAIIGNNVHVGAGSVISGVLEPVSNKPVVIEDNVFIGAGSVILPGIRVGKNSVIGAGSIVTKDVEEGFLVYGVPAKVIKKVDEKVFEKTKINPNLR